METDCRRKRAEFIDSAVKVKEAFSFAHPCEILSAVDKYCTCYYGAPLWEMRSESVKMINSSWRTNVKLTWDLPRNCRNYFLDEIFASHLTPPTVSLPSRFVTFLHSLLDSPSLEVQILCRLSARDIRTNTGSNISHVKSLTGLDPMDYGGQRIKDEVHIALKAEVPPTDQWRLPFLEKLLARRTEAFYT